MCQSSVFNGHLLRTDMAGHIWELWAWKYGHPYGTHAGNPKTRLYIQELRGKRDLCRSMGKLHRGGRMWADAESIHICGTGDGLIKLLRHVRHQQWRPCSDISCLCFVLHRKKRKVRISVYKFKYRERQAVRKLISEWLNPVPAENPGKGCVCQLTNVGPDQMCKEATSPCPSTLCYYWSKATETELSTLTNWAACPAPFTSVGLKLCNNYWT